MRTAGEDCSSPIFSEDLAQRIIPRNSSLYSLAKTVRLGYIFTLKYCSSLPHRAPWLQKVVIWAAQSYMGAKLDHEYKNTYSSIHDSLPRVDDDAFDEVLSTISKIQSIHIACWQSPASTRVSIFTLTSRQTKSHHIARSNVAQWYFPQLLTQGHRRRGALIIPK